MGITVFVFDERAALAQADYSKWVESEIRAAPKDGWDKPESSSPRLRKWFDDMRKTFPREAHPDDPYGTEYCFYENVIDVICASSRRRSSRLGDSPRNMACAFSSAMSYYLVRRRKESGISISRSWMGASRISLEECLTSALSCLILN